MAKGAIQARKKKARKESKEQSKARSFNKSKFPQPRPFTQKKNDEPSDLLPEVNFNNSCKRNG